MVEMPPIPDEDHDFTPYLARNIIAMYQKHIAVLEAKLAEQETTLWARFKDILSTLEATPPAPKVTEADIDDAAVAAIVALARHNIPADIQELLVRGDPMRSIPPGALSKSFAAALKALTAAQESGQ